MLRLSNICRRFSKSYFGVEKFGGNLPQATVSSLTYLTRFPKETLAEAVDIFRENLLPKENITKIPSEISQLLRVESHLSTVPESQTAMIKNYEDLFSRLEHISHFIEAAKQKELNPAGLAEAIKVVTEFCDKGKFGFLSGDLSIDLLEVLLNHMSHIETENLESNQEVFTKLEEYLTQTEFSLPKHGVKHSLHENPQALFVRELLVEKDTAELIMNKIKNDYEALTHRAFGLNYLTPKEKLIKLFLPFCRLIRVEQEQCVRKDLSPSRQAYAHILLKCAADKLAIITLNSVLRLAAPMLREADTCVTIKFSSLVEDIGNDVEKQILEGRKNELFEKFKKKRKGGRKIPMTDERLVRKLLNNELREIKQEIKMDQKQIYEVGGTLLKLLIESNTKRDESGDKVELIKHKLQPEPQKKKIGVVEISMEFLKLLMGKVADGSKDTNMMYIERTLPMICPPARWTDWETGGYLQKGYPIMRLQGSKLQKTALERADLSQICEVLNIMGDTSWRINRRVLEVVEMLYSLGGGVGEIPIVDDGKKFVANKEMSLMQRQKLAKDKKDNWSLLSDFELKLGIARKFKDLDRFYMPLNVDFRGRIYPISPHLNQIGNDTSRGLLEFADGKPIGKGGIRWLKIHLANKMGYDKLPLEDRVGIIENMMADVYEMAEDPITHRDWLNFEDPWQSLATIFDLTEALRSSEPEKYISRLHIHQDGSCNGLQHYAALGRDVEGAEQVNLADREKPGDLYTAVSNEVQEIVNRDAAKGKKIAEKLVGKIKRKIVKQTVMTSVYGVTFIGARDQIMRQLKDREVLPEEELATGANYLAGCTMAAIANLFQGAQRIKEWLIDCASLISKRGYPVSWITPMGLPVVQPYRRGHSTMFIDTVFQRVTLMSSKDHLPVSVPKQKSAFPPNYVHSLDSTHLMLTAVECQKEGIEFAAVHDSFWTHASDIDRMNEILRERFVHLHSMPLLDDLLEGFKTRYPRIKFKDLPERGNFDLSRVLDSTYFFA